LEEGLDPADAAPEQGGQASGELFRPLGEVFFSAGTALTATALNGSPALTDLGLISGASDRDLTGSSLPTITAEGYLGPNFATVQELATTLGVAANALVFNAGTNTLSVPFSVALVATPITGTVTSFTGTKYDDTGADFGQEDSLVGRRVKMTSGAASGEFRTIVSNTVDDITNVHSFVVDSAFTGVITNDTYEITSRFAADLALFDIGPLQDLSTSDRIEITPTGDLSVPLQLLLTEIGAPVAESSLLSALHSGLGVRTTLATEATGVLGFLGNAQDGETVTIGRRTYTFQATLTNTDGNVLIGATAADTVANLVAAINLQAGAGTAYAAATTLNPDVIARAGGGDSLVVEAKLGGTAGNSIATTTTLTDGFWTAATLQGGSAFDDIRFQLSDGSVFSADLDNDPAELLASGFGLTLVSGDDISVTLSDGNSFGVDLAGATYLGDIVRFIENAFAELAAVTNGLEEDEFEIRVDAGAGTISLIDYTDPAGNSLKVADETGASVATELGIDGTPLAQKVDGVEASVIQASYVTLGDILGKIRSAASAAGKTTSKFLIRINADQLGIDIVDATSATVSTATTTVDSTSASSITLPTTGLSGLPSDLTGYTMTFQWVDSGDQFDIRTIAGQTVDGGTGLTTLDLDLPWDPDNPERTPSGPVILALPFTASSLNGSTAQHDLGLVNGGRTQVLGDDTPASHIGTGLTLDANDDIQITLSDNTTFSVDLNSLATIADIYDAIRAAAQVANADFDIIFDLNSGDDVFADFSGGVGTFQVQSLGGSNAVSALGLGSTAVLQPEQVLFSGSVVLQTGTTIVLDQDFEAGSLVGKILRININTNTSEITANSGNIVVIASALAIGSGYDIVEKQPLVIPALGAGVNIISGDDLHGDDSSQHAGLSTDVITPHITANLALDTTAIASGISVSAMWGPLGLVVAPADLGSASASLVLTTTLDDPGNAAGITLATLDELADGLGDPDQLIAAAGSSGTISVDLPLKLGPAFTSPTLSGLTSAVDLTAMNVDVASFNATFSNVASLLTTSGTPAANLKALLLAVQDMTVDEIVEAIQGSAGYLADLQNLAQLGADENLLSILVPGLGISVAELIDLGATFDNLIAALDGAAPATLQVVEAVVNAIIASDFSGSGTPGLSLGFDSSENALKIAFADLDLAGGAFSTPFSLDLTKLDLTQAGTDLGALGLTAASIIQDTDDDTAEPSTCPATRRRSSATTCWGTAASSPMTWWGRSSTA
jgi:hypothetical protein